MISVKVEGIDRTIAKLNDLKSSVRRKVLRKAGNAGGTVGVRAVKATAPRMNNFLRRSIAKKVKTYSASGGVVLVMGQDIGKVKRRGASRKRKLKGGGISGRGDTVPSHLVENPTKAHLLPSRRPILNRFDRGSDRVFTRRIRHPGTRGAHFIRKAWQTSGGEIQRTIEEKLSAEIEVEAGRIAAS